MIAVERYGNTSWQGRKIFLVCNYLSVELRFKLAGVVEGDARELSAYEHASRDLRFEEVRQFLGNALHGEIHICSKRS